MRTARSFGAHTAETTFYTPLSNLLNAVGETLKPRVVFVAHPGNRGAGLPDGGLFPVASRRQATPLPNQRPERGAVEIKPPGESLAALAQSEQVFRYLREYGLCLITNYHQFQLVELRHGTPSVMESYDLTRHADDLWNLPVTQLAKRHAETLPDFLARVLTRRVLLEKPKNVAELLASYAREARERAAEHPIVAFDGVKSALQESLGITFEGDKGEHFFRSTLIQTLFYGIFSAWILWRRSPDFSAHNGIFNWRLSAEYLRVPVLRTLFHAVAEPGALNTVQITEVLDHATDALNRVQRDFFTTFREEDAVQYFYEPFLEAFDPELRKELGVWYTPREIVRYMVERVDHLLRTELHEPLGLASPNVQVLDPCCGTGAYLVEVLRRIERTLREHAGDDDALVGADLRRAATTRIFGFEIMPAPFVISHLQIAQLLEDARASLPATQRAQVFLTNALTGWVPARHPQSSFGFPAFAAERDAAEAVKQAETILVILGNPPYNGYAGIAKIEEELALKKAYRGSVAGAPKPEGQGLNDLYVRFFRVAERRLLGDRAVRGNASGRGILCFITNSSWLDGFSHPTMRSQFLERFSSIQIDNLNGDKYRTGKTTPEGLPDPSVFSTKTNKEGIQPGTAISTLWKSVSRPARTVRIRSLWGKGKLNQLSREAVGSLETPYDQLDPEPRLGFPFASLTYTEKYLNWPLLSVFFNVNFAGIKTSRDQLLINIDREELEHRVVYYLDPSVTDNVIARRFPGLMKANRRYKAKEIREQLVDKGFRPWQIRRIVYRPFDLRYIYWEPETKLLDEKREEYLGGFLNGLSIVLPKQSRVGYSGPFVTSALADLNSVDGGANVLANETLHWTSLHGPLILANWSEAVERWAEFSAILVEDLFPYILSTLHTPRYQSENIGALERDWPRIPLPATADLLAHSAVLGRRVSELLDPESDLQLAAEWSFLARLSVPDEFPEGTPDRDRLNAARFAITAGWGGRGQGDTVMPRRGKAPVRDWNSAELERLTFLAAAQNLTLEYALALIGARCVDVHLNNEAFWTAVPTKVWEYTLGGYQVLKKWLSYREGTLLGRPLHEDEARYFSQVVRRISAILLLGPALDASYAAILPTACGLPSR